MPNDISNEEYFSTIRAALAICRKYRSDLDPPEVLENLDNADRQLDSLERDVEAGLCVIANKTSEPEGE